MEKSRRFVQYLWLFLSNGYLAFPFSKTLYQGPLKILCSPGLNCYSCPAATLYCPLGSLQQLLLGLRFNLQTGSYYIGMYVVGCMGVLGALFGRFICGWACPFGLFQELLHKIPSPTYTVPPLLRWGKYITLLFLVILFPLLLVDSYNMGQPWFCKYLCPAGTLEAGIPMLLLLPELRTVIGTLFWGKLFLALFYITWSVVASRPFCQTSCPLGGFYALLSKYSLLKLVHIQENCTRCGECHGVCPVDIRFNENPESCDCIKCLKCKHEACNFNAIELDVAGYRLQSKNSCTPLKP